jgi:predicted nucleic acid-binding protein
MLIDSNILIYAADPRHSFLREFIKVNVPVVSIVSYIEVVGYNQLTDEQRQYFDEFFAIMPPILVSQRIAEKAVALRQQRKMSLGDSIIAATALVENHTLVTRNTDDFKWIAELKLFNPFAKKPDGT